MRYNPKIYLPYKISYEEFREIIWATEGKKDYLEAVKLICDFCGKKFDRISSHIKKPNSIYCSRKCFGANFKKNKITK